jgi:hypothetical protein
MTRLKRAKYRVVSRRKPRTYLKRMGATAKALLDHAAEIFDQSANLDTAVRDSISQGLAHIVEAAYDTEACARGYDGPEFDKFRHDATAQWFRDREYVQWFCEAAAVCFRSSKPRTNFNIVLSKAHRKKGTAA